MSKRVVSGIISGRKPHPATKWGLLMVLLVVVVLGVPKIASASQPQVSAPSGPRSGSEFTGTYTFDIYMYCTSGLDYNTSYSDYRTGSNTYDFYGAPDGSLLVSIDGGGMQVLQSCGNPFNTPATLAASYTVDAGTPPPPTPTPSPTPTPTPSATPHPSGTPHATPTPAPPTSGQSSGGSSGSGPSSGGSAPASPHSTPAADSGTSSLASTAETPAPSLAPAQETPRPQPVHLASPQPVPASSPAWLRVAATVGGALLLIAVIGIAAARSRRFREWLTSRGTWVWLRLEPYWFRARRAVISRLRLEVRGRDQLKRRGFSEHHHSGKLLAHHHTSYASLAFLLLVSFVLAGAVEISNSSADSSSSELLSLTVEGPPPSTGATISSPLTGANVSDAILTVLGTCPSGLFVEIWDNGSFDGDTACDVNDLYTVEVTLSSGENDLIARDVDGLGQYGPDSATVVVTYTPPPPPPPTPTPSPTPPPAQTPTPTPSPAPSSSPQKTSSSTPTPTKSAALVVSSAQHYYQGASPGQTVSWSMNIAGGVPPYTISWQWGDGKTDTTYASAPGAIPEQHNYTKPGIYQLTVTVQDASGHQAVLDVVVVVNGPVSSTSLGQSTGGAGNLVTVWPLLTLSSLVVLSLWLGEHHKLAMMKPQLVHV